MKEDILEQLVDDYLQTEGFFTRHNIKFLPRKDHPDFESKLDSNHSDIDVIGVDPRKKGTEGVYVVSCKSWQAGFRVESKLAEICENKTVSGRKAWQGFRELVKPKWSEAFIDAVEECTGSREFTYILAVTRINGDPKLWETHPPFIDALHGNPIRLLSVSEIIKKLSETHSTTQAPSTVGRLLQVMRASNTEDSSSAR